MLSQVVVSPCSVEKLLRYRIIIYGSRLIIHSSWVDTSLLTSIPSQGPKMTPCRPMADNERLFFARPGQGGRDSDTAVDSYSCVGDSLSN